MTRILIRAGKSPLTVMDSYDTYDKNVIGNNNGNLLFSSAVHKLLSAEGVDVQTHGLSFRPSQAPKVSAEFDKFVLPLANAFRPSFARQLDQITEFIENLDIPTVMISGGAQSGPDGSFDNLRPIEASVKRFCRAVLRTSSKITVRGEKTAEYIRSLGFSDVLAIGCPSMTMNGPGHKVRDLVAKSRYSIAYNIESSKDIMGELVAELEKEHDATYFPQDMATFEMMLWGVDRHKLGRDSRLPLRSDHPQFLHNRAEFHLDPEIWIRRMKTVDLSIGPRIHGNVIPILAGTPAVVFAHDSRTLELSEYHEIPHFRPEEVEEIHTLDQVIERVDFSAFNNGHRDRFDKVANFLHENGLRHIFEPGQEDALRNYENSINTTRFPSPQRTEWTQDTPNDRKRRQRAREFELKTNRLVASLRKELTETKKELDLANDKISTMNPSETTALS